jgi:MoxR-like ATPase
LLTCLFAGGHALFEGVPGLAKTLLIQTLADILDLSFRRIQFTPDLMPSDITGTEIIDTSTRGEHSFRFVQGPVFAHILLADEINRTPPKTQAALLQAMQEHQVTSGGKTYPLAPPFHVFATQNPIEQEGTYPLPEAQLDRFMLALKVGYPSREEEIAIVTRTTSNDDMLVDVVLNPQDIIEYQTLVRHVPVTVAMVEYAVALTRATRPGEISAPPEIKEFVSYGAGPRGAQFLILASKARALLQGRYAVDKADIRALLGPVLCHRIIRNFSAAAQEITVDHLLARVLAHVEAP